MNKKNSSNPVYYAQYATARLHSIIQQADERGINPDFIPNGLLTSPKEQEILINLDNFEHIVTTAIRNRAVNMITDYIQNIAKLFHSYYGETKIIDDKQLEKTQARLGLIVAIRQVLANAFSIIGIDVIDKM